MIRKLSKILAHYRNMDRALLFARLFMGAMLGAHVGWKIWDYEFLISGYPALLFGSSVGSFVVFTAIEALCALLFVCGLWVRFAAFIMLLGVVVDVVMLYGVVGWFGVELQILYGGIYLVFLFSGAGRYSLDHHFSEKSEENG